MTAATPPKLFLRFFRWFCHADLRKYIEGDLMELYQERLENYGKRRADIKFIADVLLLFRPGIIKSARPHQNFNKFIMYKSYFKIGWRHLLNDKWYSLINIAGLAVGICASIIIYLITSYEFSFDRFHPDGDRIFRITGESQRPNGDKQFLNSPISDVAGFQYSIPGFEAKAALFFIDGKVGIVNDSGQVKNFNSRHKTIVTEPGYFDIFNYKWLAGNPKNALNEPNRIVLTQNAAKIYFGDIPVDQMIGKMVLFDDSLQLSVSGIIKGWGQNTDFGYTNFISLSTAPHSFLKNYIPKDDWSSLSPHKSMAFVKLNRGVTTEQVNEAFTRFIDKNVQLPSGWKLTMQLQPLEKIHFTEDFHRGDDGDNFRKAYLPTLYSMMGISLFILIIAAVNFINLSTAQSMKKAKEIGIRKVLGGKKGDLVLQFLTETFLLTLFAVSIAVILVQPMLSLLDAFIPKGVEFHIFNASTLGFLLLITIITAILAGFYPASILSSYRPALSLKGNAVSKSPSKWNLRKGLIIFQFTFSMIFIIAAIVIGNQIRFMDNVDKGFNTNAIITLNNWNDNKGKLKVFAEKIKHLPGIDKVLLQGAAPMGFAQAIDNFKHKDGDESSFQVHAEMGDEEYVPYYKMKILVGRNMSPGDSLRELLINETFSKTLGFATPQEAIGKLLYKPTPAGADKAYPIVGVVADFYTGSFHEAIPPVVIENVSERKQSVAIKLAGSEKNTTGIGITLSKIEDQWKEIFPDTPFDYSFLDESITWLFDQEQKTERLVNIALFITIFISCIGLFGLIMFTAESKTKEIGIRKVLGASVATITVMLGRDFFKLVIISILIASPIAYYFMHLWLQDFVYRTTIQWWVFVLSGISSMLITLITISIQAIKAAIVNPVNSLRSE